MTGWLQAVVLADGDVLAHLLVSVAVAGQAKPQLR